MRGPRLRLLLALLVLTALVLTALDTRDGGSPFDPLRRGVDTVLGPVQRAAGSAVRTVVALPRRGDDAEVARLRAENDALRRQLVDQEGLQATRQELADLLALKDAGSYTTVLARVVGYGPAAPFARTVTLDVGSGDGVREGQTVTSGRGLVGRTVQVGPSTTVVALVTDPTVGVGVRLNRAPRSFGVVTGRGSGDLALELVEPADAGTLQVGDALVTAGSGTFVPGVPVGRVTAVDTSGGGPVRRADVEPYADLGGLDLLQVVVEGPRTTPRVPVPPS